MMYRYRRTEVGNFRVFAARVKVGDTHRRRFSVARSDEQHTVNIYTKGVFALICDGAEFARISGGMNSISDPVEYPLGREVVETALEDGLRLCVEPIRAVEWTRVPLPPGEYALKAGDALVSLHDDPVKVIGVESDGTYVLDRVYLRASLG